ncbi:MAG: hypothetical protein HGA78_07945 [Nitrospirales bacterium]|nr:hypothetical protein [Nitrospirales bacterium]
MDEKQQLSKPACAEKSTPFPEIVPCPGCGQDLEFWTDEEEITCKGCGHTITRQIPKSC